MAVEHPLVALPRRRRLDTPFVATGVLLAESERADAVVARHRRQEALLLGVGAEPLDDFGDAEVERDCARDGHESRRQFLGDEREFHHPLAAAAVLFGDCQSGVPTVGEVPENRFGVRFVPVEFVRARNDVRLRELPSVVPNCSLRVRECESHEVRTRGAGNSCMRWRGFGVVFASPLT